MDAQSCYLGRMSNPAVDQPFWALVQAVVAQGRHATPDARRDRVIFGHSTLAECRSYAASRGWSVVGHRLDLLVQQSVEATFAVVARNQFGELLAITPVGIDGQLGMGIINLSTAAAEFAIVPALGGTN
jgi:hypothetical protein